MKTIKTTLIAALLLFTVNAALAQDKYEHAVVLYQTNTVKIYLGKELKEIKLSKEEMNLNSALKEVNKLSEQGWEVYNTTVDGTFTIQGFYLRKKVS